MTIHSILQCVDVKNLHVMSGKRAVWLKMVRPPPFAVLYLDGLPVFSIYVHSDNSLVGLWVGGVDEFIIQMSLMEKIKVQNAADNNRHLFSQTRSDGHPCT